MSGAVSWRNVMRRHRRTAFPAIYGNQRIGRGDNAYEDMTIGFIAGFYAAPSKANRDDIRNIMRERFNI